MKKFFVLLVILSYVLLGHAQILNVQELVNNSSKKIPLGKHNIVDINSRLEVGFDKNELALKISTSGNKNTELISQLNQLNFILEQQVKILKILEDSCRYSYRKDLKILGDYSVMMDEFYNRLKKNDTLRKEVNHLFAEYFQNISMLDKTVYPSPQTYVIKKLAGKGAQILEQIRNSDDVNKVNIQLVAFLNTKAKQNQKVHVENFDTYSAGEYYEVERWVTSFSEEELQAFQKTSELAGQLNQVVSNGFSSLNDMLATDLPSYSCALNLLEQLNSFVEGKDSLLLKNEQNAEGFINEMQGEVMQFVNLVEDFSQLKSGDSLLQKYNIMHDSFFTKCKNLPTDLDSLSNLFMEQLKQVNEPVVAFCDSLKMFTQYFEADIQNIKAMVEYAEKMLTPFKNTANTASDIGKEVLDFTLDKLPAFGIIDLKTTGARQNGDELSIKLLINDYSDNQKKSVARVIEYETLSLQQINIYSETKISLILASPYNNSDEVALENRFQFAPSGSLLFKFGSRNSRSWNYLNPGLGINMSTPDFNMDGTPDVAFGGVFSILKDVAMVGWSYNIQTDSPFWFFGLSLPFSMPGAPVNTIQTKSID